ncbi:MAG: hypothetical protein GVY18_18515, partial [Bacteroidetes bacterium]|nr:hypothetical protein [Bacteroidota bacterium]
YRYSLGGFYRYDEGPVVTGLPTEGLQLKGNITRLLDDGYLRLHAKYLDDEAQFFLPFPHETESQEAADGIDGDEITTINAEEAADFSFRTPDGVFESDMANGIVARGAQVMFEAFRDLGDGFTVESKTKWTDMHHEFNIFIPFPAFIPTDDYGSQFVDDPETQRARFTYANSPTNAAYTGQYVIDQGAWDWERPYTDIATDLQVSKDFVAGTATHNVTVGAFLSRTQVNQRDIHNSVLVEFADQPQLLDLTIQNAASSAPRMTRSRPSRTRASRTPSARWARST